MQIVVGHNAFPRARRPPAVAIGNFDGVHLGHRRLFEEAKRRADVREAATVVLTFAPHPAKVLNPHLAPPLICTPERKRELCAAAGVDVLVEEPFDAALAACAPDTFVRQILVEALGAREVCVGYDFTYGQGRAGKPGDLAAVGRAATPGGDFEVFVLAPVTVDGLVCSSTKVREFVLEGRVEGAALLLGRDPEVEGVVVTGAGRGRTISVPTANLRPSTELLPAAGVYAGWARLDDGRAFAAAINVGTNPTFAATGGRSALSIEAHLLDYPADGEAALPGRALRLGFRRRLRDERRFPSVEALVAQIHADIAETRKDDPRPSPTPGAAAPEVT